jgi:signal transduction histidine kinase
MSIVIKNLLDNAEKYAPASPAVEITSDVGASIVSISVRDFGPGIDRELIKEITYPYVRGKNVKQPGFGLGLSICKKVMASHNGTLKIENMPDKGCCFTISWNYHKLKL